MFPFDTPIVIALNHFAHIHSAAMYAAVFFARYVAVIIIVALIIYVFHDLNRAKIIQRGLVALVAVFAGLFARYIVKSIILLGYSLSRPYITLKDITILIPPILKEETQSFPSGHALFFFALSTVVYSYNKKLGSIFFLVSVLMGVARVTAGVHYPSDIVGGMILGILSGLLCTKLLLSKINNS